MKWEHLTVTIRFSYETGKIRETVTGTRRKTYAREEQITIQEYLRLLSHDGWDLSSIVGANTYLFSRRVKKN